MSKSQDTGKIPGNQTPNTPDFNESEQRGSSDRGNAKRETDLGKVPGNQEPNTPDVNESERR